MRRFDRATRRRCSRRWRSRRRGATWRGTAPRAAARRRSGWPSSSSRSRRRTRVRRNWRPRSLTPVCVIARPRRTRGVSAALRRAGDGRAGAALARSPGVLRGSAPRARAGWRRRRVVLRPGRARPRFGRTHPGVLRADRGPLLAAGARARRLGVPHDRFSVRRARAPGHHHGSGADVGGAGRISRHLVRGAGLPVRPGQRPGGAAARSPPRRVGRRAAAPPGPLAAGAAGRPGRALTLLRDVVCPPQLSDTTSLEPGARAMSKGDDRKLAALAKKNAAKAAKAKPIKRRRYDDTLPPEREEDLELRDFFSEMKKREF